MKMLKKGIENIQFGFVRAGYDLSASRTYYSTTAKIFLHLIFLKAENKYICHGRTAINKQKTPFPFNQHEFSGFYEDNPPRLSNNENNAVNELIQSIIIH